MTTWKTTAAALTAALLVAALAGIVQSAPKDDKKAPEKLTPAQQQKRAAEELGLIEELVAARELYLKNMKRLVDFYDRTGNALKRSMAREELDSLAKVTMKKYIIVGEALGPNLRPQKNIPEAEKLFKEARQLDKETDFHRKKESRLKALSLYLELMTRYPESIRIADAAYYSAEIHETVLQDHHTAVIYYERTFQWDPLTEHEARVKAARICYYKLHELAKAKYFYEKAMKNSPTVAGRSDGQGMYNLLSAWGY